MPMAVFHNFPGCLADICLGKTLLGYTTSRMSRVPINDLLVRLRAGTPLLGVSVTFSTTDIAILRPDYLNASAGKLLK